MNRIDALSAPLFISWQLTRDCDLACLHCCTDSAPGKRLADELDAREALALAADIVRNDVPYVMLCGGEPLTVPHFIDVAEFLGRAGESGDTTAVSSRPSKSVAVLTAVKGKSLCDGLRPPLTAAPRSAVEKSGRDEEMSTPIEQGDALHNTLDSNRPIQVLGRIPDMSCTGRRTYANGWISA